MKKVILILCLLLLIVPPALADWSVTVNWTHSVGPNLDVEKVFLDGVEQCEVAAADVATCPFTVSDITSQVVTIISYNTQGNESAPYVAGTLTADPAPASATSATIILHKNN